MGQDAARATEAHELGHAVFPPDPPFHAGLTSAYNFAFLFGKDESEDAERGLYADFLDEAAVLLEQPALRETAMRCRRAPARLA